MKRLLLILIPLIIFVSLTPLNSCRTKEQNPVIDELLIFGHSGLAMKDSLNNFYPSHALHYIDSVRLEFDSTRVDIRRYFEYKRDSFVKIAKRWPSINTEYFSILPDDTIGFNELINNTLANKKFKAEYGYDFPDSILFIYDGYPYKLYYKTSNDLDFQINYIPEYLPDSLKSLHDFVLRIIEKSNLTRTNEFNFHPLTTKEAKRIFELIPPPPLP